MKGAKPLSHAELRSVHDKLQTKRFGTRNVALLMLGVGTGFRISELLSVRICDVFEHGIVGSALMIEAKHMKKAKRGRTSSRRTPLHEDVRCALRDWIDEFQKQHPNQFKRSSFLFLSRKGDGRAITRGQAQKIFSDAFKEAKVHTSDARMGTHSMRKTFAKQMYLALDKDILKRGPWDTLI